MRQSQLFTKTTKNTPADETSVNAQLLLKGGFIDKQMAGAYSYLPLGDIVFKKIVNIIRDEMNAIGGQEMTMTSLQPKDLWQTTERWDTIEKIMYKFEEKSGAQVGLAWTHEEAVTKIATKFISSYRDLPKYVYQIQTKFRNEPRAKSGILRTREFVMKDLYSFHSSEQDLDEYYEIAKKAYINIFKRCGLDALVVEASGGAFTKKYSHEFQVLSGAGEDNTVYCSSCKWAQNSEVTKVKAGNKCPDCGKKVAEGKSIEVGNIFKLGTKFSEAFKLNFTDATGKQQPVIMASYGIGPGRVMGTIVEVHHDDEGIVWPASVAPFYVHLISLGDDKKIMMEAEKIYNELRDDGIDVLWDERDASAGEKFKDADLLGLPLRVVISSKTQGKVEVKCRNSDKVELISVKELMNK